MGQQGRVLSPTGKNIDSWVGINTFFCNGCYTLTIFRDIHKKLFKVQGA